MAALQKEFAGKGLRFTRGEQKWHHQLWWSEANDPCWNRAVCTCIAQKTHSHVICVKGDKRALTDALVCVDRPMTRARKRVFTQQPVCVCRVCTHTQTCVSFDVWSQFSAVFPLKFSSVSHTVALFFFFFFVTDGQWGRGQGVWGDQALWLAVAWATVESVLEFCCSPVEGH